MKHCSSIFSPLPAAIAFAVLLSVCSRELTPKLRAQTRSADPSASATVTPAAATPSLATQDRIQSSYGNLPISFEVNQGQTDKTVQFLARAPGYTLFLTPGEAVLSLHAALPNRKRDSADRKNHPPRYRPTLSPCN